MQRNFDAHIIQRHIDGAHDYANSAEAGEGVRRALKDNLVKREDLFITSKLWNNYHAKPHVLEMAEFENNNCKPKAHHSQLRTSKPIPLLFQAMTDSHLTCRGR